MIDMKQLTILFGKAMIVELPEGTHHWRMDYYMSDHLLCWPKGKGHADDFIAAILPPGNWRIIGMLSEVTEQQAAEMVGWVEKAPGLKCFVDYKKGRPTHSLFTALESLESAILAEGYTFYPEAIEVYDAESECYRFMESRVLCRERCLLLGREG